MERKRQRKEGRGWREQVQGDANGKDPRKRKAGGMQGKEEATEAKEQTSNSSPGMICSFLSF
jgi:hypothetical protein